MSSYLEGTYNKIPDPIRDRLVEMVIVEKSTIKEAATLLKLKYSTAKTIYKIYKKENRTFKYSSRSRNPGASKNMIKKIQKAPLPSFVVKRTVNSSLVCGVVPIRKLKQATLSSKVIKPKPNINIRLPLIQELQLQNELNKERSSETDYKELLKIILPSRTDSSTMAYSNDGSAPLSLFSPPKEACFTPSLSSLSKIAHPPHMQNLSSFNQ